MTSDKKVESVVKANARAKGEDVTSIRIGDSIRYKSSAGTVEGHVKNIRIDLNAKGDMIPWITIAYRTEYSPDILSVMICGSDDYLKMMKFEVTFSPEWRS